MLASAAPVQVGVIDDPSAAVAVLDPLRARILGALREPGSASTVARDLGESRQRVNYHLRALEERGVLREVGHRQRRGLSERIVQATAESYVVSPSVLGELDARPDRCDRLSTAYLLAVAARLLREVATLSGRSDRAEQPLATLTLDSELRFGSPDARAAFTAELTAAVHDLVARYHDESAPGGRWHRLVVAAHPSTPPDPPTEEQP